MKNLHIIKRSMVILTLVAMLSLVAPAMAQGNRVTPQGVVPAAPSPILGPVDPVELEAFLDQLFAKHMEEYQIAGAAVSVVKDGKLFFAKGYGYADLGEGVTVDPEKTIFRTGSIGKVFTWTAVMQLVEQGKLDLEADINTYLDFRIPDTYPQPISLKHLMTHTSGFEERWFGSAVTDAKDVVPARDWLVSHMSARVRPPGEYAGYANYNAMLAGYIVGRVSGQPYDQYIQEHIFNPLGMDHSSVYITIPPDLRPYLSVGYTVVDGVFQPFPDYIAQPAGQPSGLHRVSVTDMGRFMIALLNGGSYRGTDTSERRILKEATAQQMHSTLYTPDPRLPGIAYGLFDLSDNGQRTLGHSGYGAPMHSFLLLLPDQDLGIYVVYNSRNARELTGQHSGFQKAFFDHYYPAPAVEPVQPPADFTERAGRFVGSYRYASNPSTTLIKIIELMGANIVEISDPGDGTLLFNLEGNDRRFTEVEPLYFRQVDGPFSAVFQEDEQGRITAMSTDLMPQYSTLKLGWYQTPGFNMALLVGCILIFLSMIPAAVIRLIRDRRLSGVRKPASPGLRAVGWVLLVISLLNPLVTLATVWGLMFGMPNELIGPPLLLKIALGLGVLSTVLTAGALVYMVLAWKNRYWGIVTRLYYTLVTVAAVAFVWFLNYWNLLGWRL